MPLDIGVGILVSILASYVFGADLSFKLAALSSLSNLIPDLDVFVELAKRGRIGGRVQGHHRKLTHFPITYIPISVLTYYFFGELWAFVISINLLAHFLHDSVCMGWGIKWFWPFSKRSYKFFSEKDGSFSANLITSWSPSELKSVVARYGDNHWFRDFYLRLHPVAVFEFLFLIFSLIIMFAIKV